MHMDEVSICYGMTETSPVSTQTRADDSIDRRVSTVGRVRPAPGGQGRRPGDRADRTARRSRASCAPAGYSVMLGYWDEPDKTAEAIDAARWMHTGDLGVMDDEGYVNIVGRIKDMVIRGGENIYPREVEEFLYTHPDIAGRAGHRGAGREVRRRADGLGADARRAPTRSRSTRCASSAPARSPSTRSPGTCT